MTTPLTTPRTDPTASAPSRGRRPGRALLVVGIVTAAAAALVALALMALGGLALIGLAVVGPPEPASAATQAPPASTAVEAPPAAHDDAGAIAFTQHWTRTVQDSFRTGDPEPVRATSTPECSACQAVVAAVTDPSRAPHPSPQTTLTVIGAEVDAVTPETTRVHVVVRVDHSFVDLGGGAVDVSGLEFENEVTLRWAGDHWLVDAVDGDAWTPVLV